MTNKKAKRSPLKKTVLKKAYNKSFESKKFVPDIVLTEVYEPGIIAAKVVKGYDKSKPAFVNELVKLVDAKKDKRLDKIGLSKMTYIRKDDVTDESLLDSNGYPIRCFLKYVEDDNKQVEEAKKFGEGIKELLNSFEYKFRTEFVYGGDMTKESQELAGKKLLSCDVNHYSYNCYLPYIKDGSFFDDTYLMESLYPNDDDPKRHFAFLSANKDDNESDNDSSDGDE